MELFEVETGHFSSDFTGDGRASITHEVLYVEELNRRLLIVSVIDEFPIVR